MPKRKDLAGLKFYMLEAVEVQGHDKYSTPLWLCKCDCGNTVLVRSCDLTWGDKRNCGCIPKGTRGLAIPPGAAIIRPGRTAPSAKEWRKKNKQKLREYERRARKKNPKIGRKGSSNYYHRHPERIQAKTSVSTAISKGILPKQSTCACANPDCTQKAEQYHHWSYEQENWLSVIPLCKACHLGLHSGVWQLNDPQKYTIEILVVNQAD